jgi:hypothetical protein
MASSGILRRVALERTDARCMRWLLVTDNVPSSPIVATLMMQALGSSETSVLTRATRRNIQEDDILYGTSYSFNYMTRTEDEKRGA